MSYRRIPIGEEDSFPTTRPPRARWIGRQEAKQGRAGRGVIIGVLLSYSWQCIDSAKLTLFLAHPTARRLRTRHITPRPSWEAAHLWTPPRFDDAPTSCKVDGFANAEKKKRQDENHQPAVNQSKPQLNTRPILPRPALPRFPL